LAKKQKNLLSSEFGNKIANESTLILEIPQLPLKINAGYVDGGLLGSA